MKRILALLLVCLMLVGCGGQTPETEPIATTEATVPPTEAPSAVLTEQALAEIAQLGEGVDDNYRTFYEIFVYSFCDSDGNGIGDLQGVISKLDYLKELGIQGIWLMPIHPSTTYHKYNVSDYYAIDPAYGTMEDFDALMAECEKRDIHVILDLVLNHTGSEHAWFKEAYQYLQSLPAGAEPNPAECKYLDYYFFQKEAAGGYCEVTGTEWFYEARFNYDMPDLNLANPEVRDEIKAIMEFWLNKGVAGFRLDAAKEFYSGGVEQNIEVLSFLQETAEAIKPDVYMVAEVWEGYATIARYYESGITSLFDFAFGDSTGVIVKTLRGAGQSSVVSKYAASLEGANEKYSAGNPEYINAPFLSNHDVGRIAGFVMKDPCKVKLAGAMNLFMSGSTFIYYGEEIGMLGSGNDPSKRAPMYWNVARDNGTTDLPPECTLPDEYPFGSLEEQVNDDASVYNYYRQAIAIRNALPVISHGATVCEEALNAGCISAQRKIWNEEECIILMNISANAAQVDLSAYEGWTLAASLSADGNPIAMNGAMLDISAYGVAVLLPNA